MPTGVFCTTPSPAYRWNGVGATRSQTAANAKSLAKARAREVRIIQLLDDKMSVADIAVRMGVMPTTIAKTCNRLRKQGRIK